MAIKPVSLPSGAGLPYGEGDVRHFSEGDAVNVPGLANPTRHLAQRDNLLAQKMNECIEVINNREQFVPLPVLRTVVTPGAEEVITNYRIPQGFEARVLNAAVGSTPISAAVELNVYYATGFGATTGVAVVTTSTEFIGGVSFQQAGEFIVTVKNRGDVTLDVTASILLTMRPLGAEGTLLVGSVIAGPPGLPGQTGPPGPPGNPGTGGAGSPGMVWTGTWTFGRIYVPKEVASYTSAVVGSTGSVTSSAIVLVGHTADNTNRPPTTPFWDLVAQGSAGTAVGATGAAGPAGAPTNFAVNIVNGTLSTGSDWLAIPVTGYATSISPSSIFKPGLNEYLAASQSGTLAWLFGSIRLNFRGSGTLALPKSAFGARLNYDNTNIQVTVAANGTQAVAGSQTLGFTAVPVGGDSWVIQGQAASPQPAVIKIFGAQSA